MHSREILTSHKFSFFFKSTQENVLIECKWKVAKCLYWTYLQNRLTMYSVTHAFPTMLFFYKNIYSFMVMLDTQNTLTAFTQWNSHTTVVGKFWTFDLCGVISSATDLKFVSNSAATVAKLSTFSLWKRWWVIIISTDWTELTVISTSQWLIT